jgi:hypothetical protein
MAHWCPSCERNKQSSDLESSQVPITSKPEVILSQKARWDILAC